MARAAAAAATETSTSMTGMITVIKCACGFCTATFTAATATFAAYQEEGEEDAHEYIQGGIKETEEKKETYVPPLLRLFLSLVQKMTEKGGSRK